MAVKSEARDICFLNLNTLNYHPLKRDDVLCGSDTSKVATKIKDSFCFRPVFPPFGRKDEQNGFRRG
ncbi:hypothetical protein HPP92_028590 [Vanilla planifolia]|uniref:Uncharacterized protein n=1 Tax=Vanilla planifolia TaxID=51239 RepID=A0A835U3Z2_VANPL|nr:hypothetical protein HPP92_028590 [Vanilla planifolia]